MITPSPSLMSIIKLVYHWMDSELRVSLAHSQKSVYSTSQQEILKEISREGCNSRKVKFFASIRLKAQIVPTFPCL